MHPLAGLSLLKGIVSPGGIPQINYSHPITSGLVGCFLPTGVGGAVPFVQDLITLEKLSAVTATATLVTRPAGLALPDISGAAGGGTAFTLASTATNLSQRPATTFSIVSVFGPRGAPSNITCNLFRSINVTGGNLVNYALARAQGSTNRAMAFIYSNTTTTITTTSPGAIISNGSAGTFCVGVSATLGGNWYMASGGVIGATGVLPAATIPYTATTKIDFGHSPANQHPNADIYYTFLWSRALSPRELSTITANPTTFLLYPQDMLFNELYVGKHFQPGPPPPTGTKRFSIPLRFSIFTNS